MHLPYAEAGGHPPFKKKKCIPVDQNFVGLSISDGYIGNENFFMFDEPPNKAKRKEKVVHSERFDWLLLYINSGIQFYQESSFSSRI